MRIFMTALIRSTASSAFLLVIALPATWGKFAAPGEQGECVQRHLPVAVMTKKFVPVPGLSGSNFQATVHGQVVHVLSAATSHRIPRIVFLVDVNNRGGSGPINGEVHIAEFLLSRLPSNVAVGLATIETKTENILAPTTNHLALQDALEGLRTAPKIIATKTEPFTPFEALIGSPPLFGTPEPGDAFFFITKADYPIFVGHTDKATRALQDAGIRLFTILLPGFLPPGFSTTGDRFLPAVTESTGGEAVHIGPPPDQNLAYLPSLLQKPLPLETAILFQIQEAVNFYDVTVEAPKFSDKPQDINLRVVGIDQDALKSLIVRYPRQVVPCTGLKAP
jgi:hypothetical protein